MINDVLLHMIEKGAKRWNSHSSRKDNNYECNRALNI